MPTPVTESQLFKNFTATNTITAASSTGNIMLLGIMVASSSSGTLKVASGTDTVVNTFSATAGTFYPIPAVCGSSVTITVGGTLDATVFYTV